MTRTPQTAKKSTSAPAERVELHNGKVLVTEVSQTPPTKRQRINVRSPNHSIIYIGSIDGVTCCKCGSGGCLIEGCSQAGCQNGVCTTSDDRRKACAPGIISWLCPLHDGRHNMGALRYNANVKVDVRSLELGSYSTWDIVLSATKLAMSEYSKEQITFGQYSFQDDKSLQASAIAIHSSWREEAEKWLTILTHTNESGDLWFQMSGQDHSAAAATIDQFLGVVLGESTYRNINLIFFVCGSAIQPENIKPTASRLKSNMIRVIDSITKVTSGKVIFFTNHNLEPVKVANPIMTAIANHEFKNEPLPETVRAAFNGNTASPLWVLAGGEGTYIHGTLLPCSVHRQAYKGAGQRCLVVNSRYNVKVIDCRAKRISK